MLCRARPISRDVPIQRRQKSMPTSPPCHPECHESAHSQQHSIIEHCPPTHAHPSRQLRHPPRNAQDSCPFIRAEGGKSPRTYLAPPFPRNSVGQAVRLALCKTHRRSDHAWHAQHYSQRARRLYHRSHRYQRPSQFDSYLRPFRRDEGSQLYDAHSMSRPAKGEGALMSARRCRKCR
jgi:hypothetical protein